MDKLIAQKLAKPNETIEIHTNNLINQANRLHNLGYIKNEILFSDLLTACNYHDYGKANSQFQKRLLTHCKFNEEKEIPHNVLSIFFIDESQCNNYTAVAFAVLYHHYHKRSPAEVFYEEKTLIKELLDQMAGCPNVYDDMYDCVDDIGELFKIDENDNTKKYAILLKGLLHKCDYSSSAGIRCEYPNDFLLDCVENSLKAKNYSHYELQDFCIDNTESDIIVTAPTGMGKTEAGLFWCGNHKCFFILPLKTAINAMYFRIQKLSGEDFKNRVSLIHSDMQSVYLKDSKKNANGELDFEYCTRSKQMSLPITVCTPDQIFDFVFRYAGYEYKLATASYSKFIIDEIQMYAPDLLASIIYGIKMIHNIGGKFAILTATLPPFVRHELIKVFGDNVIQKDFSQYGKDRHNVRVFEKTLNTKFVINTVENLKSDTVKKFLVVCNSIDTADKIFDELKNFYDKESDVEINLFHANFIKRDRADKEEKILNASKDRTKTEIWVLPRLLRQVLILILIFFLQNFQICFHYFRDLDELTEKGIRILIIQIVLYLQNYREMQRGIILWMILCMNFQKMRH